MSGMRKQEAVTVAPGTAASRVERLRLDARLARPATAL